jgi:Cdc6-like AAA superfamily ATPase
VQEKLAQSLEMHVALLTCAGITISYVRRTVEIVEESSKTKVIKNCHVNQAFKDLFASPILKALSHLSFFQRLFMASVLRRVRKLGCDQVEYKDVVEELEDMCTLQGRNAPNATQILQVCAYLSRYRLLISEISKSGNPTQKLQVF